MRFWLSVSVCVAAQAMSCTQVKPFACASDSECGDGICLGFCAVPSSDCASGFEFDSSAGSESGVCVDPTLTDGNVCLPDPAAAGYVARYCFDDYEPDGDATLMFAEEGMVPPLSTRSSGGFEAGYWRIENELEPDLTKGLAVLMDLLERCNVSGEATLELVVRLEQDSGVCGENGCYGALLEVVQTTSNSEGTLFPLAALGIGTAARRDLSTSGSFLFARSQGAQPYFTDVDIGQPDDPPVHLAVTINADGEWIVYVSGVAAPNNNPEVADPPTVPALWATANKFDLRVGGFTVGKSPRGDYHFAGAYCRALTADEIAERAAMVAAEFN